MVFVFLLALVDQLEEADADCCSHAPQKSSSGEISLCTNRRCLALSTRPWLFFILVNIISSTLAIYLSSSIICHSLKNTFDLFFTLWDMIYFVTIRYSIVHMLLLTFPDRDASLLIFLTVTFPVSDCDKGRCKYNHSLKPNPFLPAKESSEHVLGLVFKSSAQPHV